MPPAKRRRQGKEGADGTREDDDARRPTVKLHRAESAKVQQSVAEFLASLHLQGYTKQIVVDHGLTTLEALAQYVLSEDDLKEIGITALAHRRALMQAIQRNRKTWQAQTASHGLMTSSDAVGLCEIDVTPAPRPTVRLTASAGASTGASTRRGFIPAPVAQPAVVQPHSVQETFSQGIARFQFQKKFAHPSSSPIQPSLQIPMHEPVAEVATTPRTASVPCHGDDTAFFLSAATDDGDEAASGVLRRGGGSALLRATSNCRALHHAALQSLVTHSVMSYHYGIVALLRQADAAAAEMHHELSAALEALHAARMASLFEATQLNNHRSSQHSEADQPFSTRTDHEVLLRNPLLALDEGCVEMIRNDAAALKSQLQYVDVDWDRYSNALTGAAGFGDAPHMIARVTTTFSSSAIVQNTLDEDPDGVPLEREAHSSFVLNEAAMTVLPGHTSISCSAQDHQKESDTHERLDPLVLTPPVPDGIVSTMEEEMELGGLSPLTPRIAHRENDFRKGALSQPSPPPQTAVAASPSSQDSQPEAQRRAATAATVPVPSQAITLSSATSGSNATLHAATLRQLEESWQHGRRSLQMIPEARSASKNRVDDWFESTAPVVSRRSLRMLESLVAPTLSSESDACDAAAQPKSLTFEIISVSSDDDDVGGAADDQAPSNVGEGDHMEVEHISCSQRLPQDDRFLVDVALCGEARQVGNHDHGVARPRAVECLSSTSSSRRSGEAQSFSECTRRSIAEECGGNFSYHDDEAYLQWLRDDGGASIVSSFVMFADEDTFEGGTWCDAARDDEATWSSCPLPPAPPALDLTQQNSSYSALSSVVVPADAQQCAVPCRPPRSPAPPRPPMLSQLWEERGECDQDDRSTENLPEMIQPSAPRHSDAGGSVLSLLFACSGPPFHVQFSREDIHQLSILQAAELCESYGVAYRSHPLQQQPHDDEHRTVSLVVPPLPRAREALLLLHARSMFLFYISDQLKGVPSFSGKPYHRAIRSLPRLRGEEKTALTQAELDAVRKELRDRDAEEITACIVASLTHDALHTYAANSMNLMRPESAKLPVRAHHGDESHATDASSSTVAASPSSHDASMLERILLREGVLLDHVVLLVQKEFPHVTKSRIDALLRKDGVPLETPRDSPAAKKRLRYFSTNHGGSTTSAGANWWARKRGGR